MSFSDRFAKIFQSILPTPFTIAIVLTLFVLVMGLFLNHTPPKTAVQLLNKEAVISDTLRLEATGGTKFTWSVSNGADSNMLVVPLAHLRKEKITQITLTAKYQEAGYTSTSVIELGSNENITASEISILDNTNDGKFLQLIKFWERGLWNVDLLAFLVQAMLMLVLGHVLALSKPVNNVISKVTQYCNNTANAAALVTLLTVAVGLFNWGLGLIFGAIFARKVAEHAVRNNINLNYPLIGAAGYSGLMVWHGGISGSAPIKVAEEGALKSLMSGSQLNDTQMAALPDSIGLEATVFSTMNICVALACLVILPLFMYWMGKRVKSTKVVLNGTEKLETTEQVEITGADRLTYSKIFSITLGVLIILFASYKSYEAQGEGFNLKFIDPNYINFVLLGLCFIFHGHFGNFLKGAERAISGTSGILLQFPLYFGILGVMKGSGLMTEISEFFIGISTAATYPIYTFFSAGLVNVFVPSGGGQWAIQGPVIIEAATNMGISLKKSIMAMSYGDQLTNMLQPFWALPLLAITGLKARDILPYTLLLMLVGAGIFILGLIIF